MKVALIGAAATIIAALIAAYVEFAKPVAQPPPATVVPPSVTRSPSSDPTAAGLVEPPEETTSSESTSGDLTAGQYVLRSVSGFETFEVGPGSLELREDGPERFKFTILLDEKSGSRYATASGALFRTAGQWMLQPDFTTNATDLVGYGAHPVSIDIQDEVVRFRTEDWTMEWTPD